MRSDFCPRLRALGSWPTVMMCGVRIRLRRPDPCGVKSRRVGMTTSFPAQGVPHPAPEHRAPSTHHARRMPPPPCARSPRPTPDAPAPLARARTSTHLGEAAGAQAASLCPCRASRSRRAPASGGIDQLQLRHPRPALLHRDPRRGDLPDVVVAARDSFSRILRQV